MSNSPVRSADDDAVAVTPHRHQRAWLVVHLASLAAAGLLIARAARGQWFYYDEWDFLTVDTEWALLMPHNGHLSLVPRLTTTLIKGVAGLHEYWPYLLLAVAVHLLVVHLLWRLMIRTGAVPAIATVAAFVLAMLAPGSENVLWAFQMGFMLPLATGTAALLVAMRPRLRIRDLVVICLLLLVGLASSGTALAVSAAVLLFVLIRHGWRPALAAGAVVAVPYGAWYLTFGQTPQGTSAFMASTVQDLLVRVPEYLSYGLIEGLSRTIPFPALTAALLVALSLWLVVELRRDGLRRLSPVHFLVFGAVLFSALTAVARVQLPVESAAAGRYVYVVFALVLPAAVLGLSALVGRSRAALAVVCTILAIVAAYNVGGFMRDARVQSQLELTVQSAMSAAVVLDDGSEAVAVRRPSPVVAPPLTVADVREFVARGQFDPIDPTAEELLTVRGALFLTATPTDRPAGAACLPTEAGARVIDTDTELLEADRAQSLHVVLEDGGVTSSPIDVQIPAGVSRLGGLGDAHVILEPPATGLCVLGEAG